MARQVAIFVVLHQQFGDKGLRAFGTLEVNAGNVFWKKDDRTLRDFEKLADGS